jgi:hypothetical protein
VGFLTYFTGKQIIYITQLLQKGADIEYWLYTLFGFIGETLKIGSFFAKSRKGILGIQILSSVFLIVFWLNVSTAMSVMTILALMLMIHAQKMEGSLKLQKLYLLYYPITIGVFYYTKEDKILLLFSILLGILSRGQLTEFKMRAAFLACQVLFCISGIYYQIPSIIYSTVFSGLINAYRFNKLVKQTS